MFLSMHCLCLNYQILTIGWSIGTEQKDKILRRLKAHWYHFPYSTLAEKGRKKVESLSFAEETELGKYYILLNGTNLYLNYLFKKFMRPLLLHCYIFIFSVFLLYDLKGVGLLRNQMNKQIYMVSHQVFKCFNNCK